MSKFIFITSSLFLIVSCKNFCGNHEYENLVNYINKSNTKFKLEIIDCEYYYINLHFKMSKIDTAIIGLTHNILYNAKDKKGWPVILVHSKNRKYIFSHYYDRKIFIQSGD